MIVRHAHEKGYTVIQNETLSDRRLSWKARGILVYLLSKPDGWQVMTKELIAASKEGRDAVYSALGELEEAGYLVRTGVRRDNAGRFDGTDTEIHECPERKIRTRSDLGEEGESPAHVQSGFSVSGKSAPSKERREASTDTTSTPPTPRESALILVAATFDTFWKVYPRPCAKPDALKAWTRAVRRENPDAIVAGAQRFRDDPNREDAFTPHPSTWLNQDRWNDPPLPARNRPRSPLTDSPFDQPLDEAWNTFLGGTHDDEAHPALGRTARTANALGSRDEAPIRVLPARSNPPVGGAAGIFPPGGGG